MKKFLIALFVLSMLPIVLCSCSKKNSAITNTDQMPGKGAKKMMERIKKDADIKAKEEESKKKDEEAEAEAATKGKVPIKDVRVMSNGVLYYRDNTLTNLTGVNYIDPQTGATTTPSEPDFEQSKSPAQY